MRKYSITISHLRAHNLPKKDIFTKSDTYVILYWPNTKPVRTDVAFKNSDPKWTKFKHSLEYVLEEDFVDAEGIQRFLRQQLLRIECYAKHSLRKDSVIGTTQVDLLLCLGGPSDHHLTLISDRHQEAGSIECKITARCIGTASISLHDVTCHLNSTENKQHLFLRSFLSSSSKEELETSICFHTRHPYWSSVGPFEITGDLQMVMNSTLTIHLFAKEEEIIRMKGIVNISLGKYNTASQEFIFFREPVTEQFEQSQKSLGVLEGYIAFSNLPVPCQMWKGHHKDNQIFGAAPLTTGLYTFPDINVDKLPPVFDLFHSGHLVENDRQVLDEDCQNQLRGIIERINCDEDITDALSQLITKFQENAKLFQEAFYQVGGVSVMISLLQNSLDMLPLTLPTAGETLGASEGILPSIAHILFLALDNYQKNQGFLCRSNRMNLLLRFLERTTDLTATRYLLLVVFMISRRDLSGQQSVVSCGGVPVISKILLHVQHEEISILCMKTLAAMSFGIHRSIEVNSSLIRNTGALSFIRRVITTGTEFSTELQQNAIEAMETICNNNKMLQSEILCELMDEISYWTGETEEKLWLNVFDLFMPWLSSSDPPQLSKNDIKTLFRILELPELHSNTTQSIENLFYSIIDTSENPDDLASVIDISRLQDVSIGLRILGKTTELLPHPQILITNLQTLLFHFEHSHDVSCKLDIIKILERFGTHCSDTLQSLFPAFYRLLYLDDNKLLFPVLSSFCEILRVQSDSLTAVMCSEFQYCIQRVAELFLSSPNDLRVHQRANEILDLLIVHQECYLYLIPIVKAALSRNEEIIASLSVSLLNRLVNTPFGHSMELRLTILHALEHYLPTQLIHKDHKHAETIKQEYLDILTSLASTGAHNQFRQQVFALLPSVYLLQVETSEDNEEQSQTNNKLSFFAFQVLGTFVDATPHCSFGIPLGLVQQMIQFYLKHTEDKEEQQEARKILFSAMNKIEDFASSAVSYFSHQWSTFSIDDQMKVIRLVKPSDEQGESLGDEFYAFGVVLVYWMREQLSNDTIDEDNDIYEVFTLVSEFVSSLFASPKSWKLLLPAATSLVGISESSSTWFIENALCLSFIKENSNPNIKEEQNTAQSYLETLQLHNLLSIMEYSSQFPQIIQLSNYLQENVKQLTRNVLDTTGGTKEFQKLLQKLLSSDSPSDDATLFTQCSLIIWSMAVISPLHLLQQFAKVPMLSLIAKVFASEKTFALHATGLFAFSNVLQRVPELLFDIPVEFFDMPKMVELLHKHPESIPAVCRLVLQLFNDSRFQKQFIQADGFYQLSKVMEELSTHIQSSEVARESLQEALAILVFSARIPKLRIEIIGDGLVPSVLNLLNLTRVEQIISQVLRFINFMSSEPMARREMIDSRDIDSLSAIIDQKDTYPELSESALDCYVRLGGLTKLCRVITNPEPEYQEFFRCRTCGIDCVCVYCAQVCHRGHGLSNTQSGVSICDCGTSPNCLIKERPTLRVQVPLQICSFAFTGPNYTKQAWFFCRTCFRNEQKGVCTTCAYVCHKGHDIRFGSESGFYCDCSERYGVSCKCAQHLVVAPDNLPRFRKPRYISAPEEEEEEDEESDEDESCIVCMDQPKDALFYKCGHIAACMDCACMLKQRNDPCVICRETIESVVRTFFV